MNIKHSLYLFLLFIFSGVSAQTVPQPANALLGNAFLQAADQNKKVILIFHASWCGWCHKMEASLNDPSCKKMIDDNYVTVYLDVMESKGKENLENPGAPDVMKKFKGEQSGLPFWLVLDAKGNELANSLATTDGLIGTKPADNIGCPAKENEVALFIKVLKATSNLKDTDLDIIHSRFLLNQPAVQ